LGLAFKEKTGEKRGGVIFGPLNFLDFYKGVMVSKI
jgi:hypothetical protein